MTTPVRLQLSRRRGFGLQPHSLATNGLTAVFVARPSVWGNYPAVRACVPTGAGAVRAFRTWVETEASQSWKDRAATELRGHNLACWCALDQPCHADVLLELAAYPVEAAA